MRKVLTQEGYLSGIDGLDAKKITDAWKKFKEEKAGDPDYIVARDEIKQNTEKIEGILALGQTEQRKRQANCPRSLRQLRRPAPPGRSPSR